MAKDYKRLWKDIGNTADEGKVVRILSEILADKEGRRYISNLELKHAGLCIEILDGGIAEHNLKTIEKQAFFVLLRRLAGIHGRLPDSMTITSSIGTTGPLLPSGGFTDTRIGNYSGHTVAVKTLKIAEQDDLQRIKKQFCKEVVLWNTLSHPNVLKLAGVQGDMDQGQFTIVSEWMPHGNIMQYIKKDPTKNSINRLDLLHGAAQGLEYLHHARLIHGDLKGANILMSNNSPPRACLADFGFMTIVLDHSQPLASAAQLGGDTMMFMSPELLVPPMFGFEDSIPTPEADIYAFGLVVFQVLTGENPFRGIMTAELVYDVVQGVRPSKPEDASATWFSDPLWGFLERCWDGNTELRPKVVEVVIHLGRAAAKWKRDVPPSAGAEKVAFSSEELMPVSMEYCPTEPQTTPGLRRRHSPLPIPRTESPNVDSQEGVAIQPSDEPQYDDYYVRRKRTGFMYLKQRLRDLFRRTQSKSTSK